MFTICAKKLIGLTSDARARRPAACFPAPIAGVQFTGRRRQRGCVLGAKSLCLLKHRGGGPAA